MSSVRQKMAADQKAVNKAEERLRLGEEPTPAPVEQKVEEVAKPAPEKKAAPKKKAEPPALYKAVEEDGFWYATNGKDKHGPHTAHSVGGWVAKLNAS